jgi:hypothetical protein
MIQISTDLKKRYLYNIIFKTIFIDFITRMRYDFEDKNRNSKDREFLSIELKRAN